MQDEYSTPAAGEAALLKKLDLEQVFIDHFNTIKSTTDVADVRQCSVWLKLLTRHWRLECNTGQLFSQAVATHV